MRGYAIALLIALTACGDAQIYAPPAYKPPTTHGGLMCVDQCGKSRNYCSWSCDLDYRSCFVDIQGAAQREYDIYAHYRLIHHAPVDLLPSDFEHPEKCEEEKKRCDGECDRPYNTCYTSCGGTVTPRETCSLFCSE